MDINCFPLVVFFLEKSLRVPKNVLQAVFRPLKVLFLKKTTFHSLFY